MTTGSPMNRIRAAVHALGPAGLAGAALLASCLPFYFSAVLPAAHELRAQQAAAERMRARTPVQPVALRSDSARLGSFYASFPPVDRLPDEMERLYRLAQAAHVDIKRGEYRFEQHRDGLASYRITLPIQGAYPEIRDFLSATLQQMPYAAVDALRFERKKVADTQLDAQIRLTMYFRPGDESDSP